MSEDIDLEKELENVRKVEDIIAHLYIYPSYAVVELSERFYEIVARASTIEQIDYNVVKIDDKTFSFWIDKEVYLSYDECLDDVAEEEGIEEIEEEIKKEVEELYNEFKTREKDELLAIIENSNTDFYVFAIVEIEGDDKENEESN